MADSVEPVPGRVTIASEGVRLTWSGPFASGDGPDVRGLRGHEVTREGGGCLVEEAAYAVLVQSQTGEVVTVGSRDPVVTAGLAREDGGRVVHGTVRTGSQAGRLRIVVSIGGRPAFEVEWAGTIAARCTTIALPPPRI